MTLKDWFEQRNRCIGPDVIKDDDNKHILKQILKGIEYIHLQLLLHRDLKPGNIFLSQCDSGRYRVKIGDFGLSRLLTVDNITRVNSAANQRHCTDDGIEPLCVDGLSRGVGNDLYSAPEQLQSSSYSIKADMYSVGMILYELYRPFSTCMERIDCLKRLRITQDVTDLHSSWPLQANCVRQLTDYNPALRPSAAQLLHGDGGLFLTKDQIIGQLHVQVVELQQQVEQKNNRIAELELQLGLRSMSMMT
jgi:serine/threonine protein kinase